VADLFVFDDIRRPVARTVYAAGRPVAQDGKATFTAPTSAPLPDAVLKTVHLQRELPNTGIKSRGRPIRVIGSRRDQLITDVLEIEPSVRDDGVVAADPERDILKMMVIERHRASNRVGIGFVRGFGLKRGAIAGTFAHDHHNIVAIGTSDFPIWAAALNVSFWGGGLCVVDKMDDMIASLPLPVAGLMSDRPIDEVAAAYRKLLAAAKELGSTLHDPFGALSFMALEVIPSLKLTDHGLIDVNAMKVVDLFV
jgi:adenine deaminase